MQITNLMQTQKTGFTGNNQTPKAISKDSMQKENSARLLETGAKAMALNNYIAFRANIALYTTRIPMSELEFKQESKANKKPYKDVTVYKNGERKPYTGIAEHISKKGDLFIAKFIDGKIVKSMKNVNPNTGRGDTTRDNFVKTYERTDDALIITTKKDKADGSQTVACSKISKDKITRTNALGQNSANYFRNGKPIKQRLFDGTRRHWYRNGQMEYEKSPNGTERIWYENGQILSEILPDRTRRIWYENGQMSYEKLPDGTYRRWHEDGSPCA